MIRCSFPAWNSASRKSTLGRTVAAFDQRLSLNGTFERLQSQLLNELLQKSQTSQTFWRGTCQFEYLFDQVVWWRLYPNHLHLTDGSPSLPPQVTANQAFKAQEWKLAHDQRRFRPHEVYIAAFQLAEKLEVERHVVLQMIWRLLTFSLAYSKFKFQQYFKPPWCFLIGHPGHESKSRFLARFPGSKPILLSERKSGPAEPDDSKLLADIVAQVGFPCHGEQTLEQELAALAHTTKLIRDLWPTSHPLTVSDQEDLRSLQVELDRREELVQEALALRHATDLLALLRSDDSDQAVPTSAVPVQPSTASDFGVTFVECEQQEGNYCAALVCKFAELEHTGKEIVVPLDRIDVSSAELEKMLKQYVTAKHVYLVDAMLALENLELLQALTCDLKRVYRQRKKLSFAVNAVARERMDFPSVVGHWFLLTLQRGTRPRIWNSKSQAPGHAKKYHRDYANMARLAMAILESAIANPDVLNVTPLLHLSVVSLSSAHAP